MSANTLPLNWDDIYRDSVELARLLKDKGPFTGLCAVARGGLVPAGIISRALNLRLVETVCVSSYDGRNQCEATILKRMEGDGAGWLIIDDLVDSGNTARLVRAMLPKAHYATLYAKPAGLPDVDTCVREFSQDTWLMFPWDVGD